MILRRLAFLIALFCAFLATQVPSFIQQYRQALGGAIGELAAMVARFDSDSAQQGLTQSGGVDRLKANHDRLVQQRGEAMDESISRLRKLRESQENFRSEGPVARLGTFVRHYDDRIAREAFAEFKPAVPTTPEGFVAGLLGFVFGGGVVHMAGRPLRRRVRESREARTVA